MCAIKYENKITYKLIYNKILMIFRRKIATALEYE